MKKPALSTADQVNWWKDGSDIYIAEGTMFVIHKIDARQFQVRISFHHHRTTPQTVDGPLFTGKLKECKTWVEETWISNYNAWYALNLSVRDEIRSRIAC